MTEDFCYKIAYRYYVTGESVRDVAKHFNIGKTTVGEAIKDYGKRYLDYGTYQKVRNRVDSNMRDFRKYGKLHKIKYRADITDDKDTWVNEHGATIANHHYEDESLPPEYFK